jgi:hypothetical protein
MAIPCNRPPALAAQIVLLVLVGCAERPSASQPQPKPAPAIAKGELRVLIDSLANKNAPPERATNRYVRYGQDYDHEEDKRVRAVVDKLDKQRSTEDLWWCLLEHINDDRYTIVFRYDDYSHIAMIGHLCWQKAAHDLDAPFSQVIDYKFWRQFRIGKDALNDWYTIHRGVPLYQQQIERGEVMLRKLELIKRQDREFWIPDEKDKVQIRHDIESQIALLKQTQKPIFSNEGLIPRDN